MLDAVGEAEAGTHAARRQNEAMRELLGPGRVVRGEARWRATASGQIGAAVTAIKEKGILSGKRIERREIGAPGEFETMTDEELERALMERIARLGLADAVLSLARVDSRMHSVSP
jgi:hypothetical protein